MNVAWALRKGLTLSHRNPSLYITIQVLVVYGYTFGNFFLLYLNMCFIQMTNFETNIIFIDILNRGNPRSPSKGINDETLSQGIVLLYYLILK